MSDFADKAQDKADELGGKAKDVVGDLTDDSSLQAEGKADQATAKTKQAAGQLGEAAQNVQGAAQNAAQNAVEEVKKSRGVVSALHRVGLKSEWAYAAGFASIGLALGSWFLSRSNTGSSKAQSDRWGIFVGEWAPTFMVLGVALKAEEDSALR